MNFTNYLSSIEGIDIYPIMAFVAFFTFFICISWWALRADKKRMQMMSELPLHDEHVTDELSNQNKN